MSGLEGLPSRISSAATNYIQGEPQKLEAANTDSAKQSKMNAVLRPVFRAETGKVLEPSKQLANIFIGTLVCPPALVALGLKTAVVKTIATVVNAINSKSPDKTDSQQLQAPKEELKEKANVVNKNTEVLKEGGKTSNRMAQARSNLEENMKAGAGFNYSIDPNLNHVEAKDLKMASLQSRADKANEELRKEKEAMGKAGGGAKPSGKTVTFDEKAKLTVGNETFKVETSKADKSVIKQDTYLKMKEKNLFGLEVEKLKKQDSISQEDFLGAIKSIHIGLDPNFGFKEKGVNYNTIFSSIRSAVEKNQKENSLDLDLVKKDVNEDLGNKVKLLKDKEGFLSEQMNEIKNKQNEIRNQPDKKEELSKLKEEWSSKNVERGKVQNQIADLNKSINALGSLFDNSDIRELANKKMDMNEKLDVEKNTPPKYSENDPIPKGILINKDVKANRETRSEYEGFVRADKELSKSYTRELNILQRTPGNEEKIKNIKEKMGEISKNIQFYQGKIIELTKSIDDATQNAIQSPPERKIDVSTIQVEKESVKDGIDLHDHVKIFREAIKNHESSSNIENADSNFINAYKEISRYTLPGGVVPQDFAKEIQNEVNIYKKTEELKELKQNGSEQEIKALTSEINELRGKRDGLIQFTNNALNPNDIKRLR